MFLLDLALVALFFTNIWVFVYTHLLVFLNSQFPAPAKVVFLTAIGHPEPFEIPLYLGISLLFIFIIALLYRRPVQLKFIHPAIKAVILIILSFIFIRSLSSYPLAAELDPYSPRSNPGIYVQIVFFYILSIAFIVLSLGLLHRVLKNTKKTSFVLYFILTIILFSITFDARFPMAGHDYEFFIGPTWEIINGKTIYTDILSRYGFLTPVFFALLNKIHLLNLFYIPAVIWALYVLQYLICFIMMHKISRSAIFSLVGLSSIITLNYFSLKHLPSVVPEVGPLRWFPVVLIIYLFYRFKRIDSHLFILLTAFLSFFVVDSGIAIIMSYCTTFLMLLLGKIISAARFIRSLLFLFINLLFVLLMINLVHIMLGYKIVNVFNIIYSLQKHAVLGLAMIAIPEKTYFWLVLLIYFTAIIYFFKNHVENRRACSLLIFCANMSLFTGAYFVGRSHPHNLFNMSIFPILTLFLLFGIFFYQVRSKKLKIIGLILLFILFVVIPAYQRRITLSEMILTKLDKLTKGKIFQSEVEESISQMYKDDIRIINENASEKKIAILSADDSYLFLKTGKKNLLDANPLMGIDLPVDIDFAIKNALKRCPQKIAVDCSFVGKCASYTPFIGPNFDMNLILGKIENGCNIKYEPKICSSHLCIAQVK